MRMEDARALLIGRLEDYFLSLELRQTPEPARRVIELSAILVDMCRDGELRAYFATFLSELAVQQRATTNGNGTRS
jgi:hypothetical protein